VEDAATRAIRANRAAVGPAAQARTGQPYHAMWAHGVAITCQPARTSVWPVATFHVINASSIQMSQPSGNHTERGALRRRWCQLR
jgi:hypothetical protein